MFAVVIFVRADCDEISCYFTLGIGLALTLAIGTAIGIVDQQHLAFAATASSSAGFTG